MCEIKNERCYHIELNDILKRPRIVLYDIVSSGHIVLLIDTP